MAATPYISRIQHTPARSTPGYSRLPAMACVFFFLFLFCPFAQAATPKEFTLGEPVMNMETGEVTVSLPIGVDSMEGVRDMLKDGAIMELAVTAELVRLRTLVPNVSITEKTLTSLARYNPLTREFSLTMPGSDQAIVDKNLTRLLAATWQKFSFSLGPVTMFQGEPPGSDYRLTLDLSLRHTEVPPWLAKAFVFWSWDVVEKAKLTIPFTL